MTWAQRTVCLAFRTGRLGRASAAASAPSGASVAAFSAADRPPAAGAGVGAEGTPPAPLVLVRGEPWGDPFGDWDGRRVAGQSAEVASGGEVAACGATKVPLRGEGSFPEKSEGAAR